MHSITDEMHLVIKVLFLVKMIFLHEPCVQKAPSTSGKAKNEHHHGSSWAFAASEKWSQHGRICMSLHKRLAHAVNHKAAEEKSYRSCKELKGIPACLNSSLKFQWNWTSQDNFQICTHYRNQNPADDVVAEIKRIIPWYRKEPLCHAERLRGEFFCVEFVQSQNCMI